MGAAQMTSVQSRWRFAPNVTEILVTADAGEARVAQAIVRCPFEELDACHDEGVEPAAHHHLRGGDALAPAALPTVRQVDERASRFSQLLEVRRQSAPILRRNASTDRAGLNQVASFVVPDQD